MTVHGADLILDPTAERNAPTTGVSATEQALGIVPTSDAAKTADAVLYTYKRAPGEIVRGEGVFLFDAEGKKYLDFVSGIAVNALGYADPGLVAALHAAADGLVHVSNLYETSPAPRLAAALVERSFADKVFFCNSGAEANEGAFKFARRWARTVVEVKHEIIALRGAFHGRLFATLAATDRPGYRLPFRPLAAGEISRIWPPYSTRRRRPPSYSSRFRAKVAFVYSMAGLCANCAR